MPLINRAFRWRNWKRGQPTTTIIKGASTTFNGLPNSSQTATTHTHKKVIQFPSARMLLLLLPVCHIRLFPFSLLLLLPPRFYPSSREALRPAKKKRKTRPTIRSVPLFPSRSLLTPTHAVEILPKKKRNAGEFFVFPWTGESPFDESFQCQRRNDRNSATWFWPDQFRNRHHPVTSK